MRAIMVYANGSWFDNLGTGVKKPDQNDGFDVLGNNRLGKMDTASAEATDSSRQSFW